MAKRTLNNTRLGIFVLAGLLFLVLLLYMIGKNRNLFGSTYELKAKFSNVQGLVSGNNVRFSGIQAGTVKRVKILTDTVIEVTMVIDKKMKSIIRKNAIASIGTDGLVGNKVVNIHPAGEPAPLALPGELIATRRSIDTDEMLETLYQTNNDIAIIAAELKTTVHRLNSSRALWTLLDDQSIPADIRRSVANVRSATLKAGTAVDQFNAILNDVREGKGSVGALLTDTSFATNLNAAILKINVVGERADSLVMVVNTMMKGLKEDIDNGKGTMNTLFKDSSMATQLRKSLENIERGTESFNQSMEALKHNFLLRGYFRKQEKKKARNAATNQ